MRGRRHRLKIESPALAGLSVKASQQGEGYLPWPLPPLFPALLALLPLFPWPPRELDLPLFWLWPEFP
jgi:hypothetical protein